MRGRFFTHHHEAAPVDVKAVTRFFKLAGSAAITVAGLFFAAHAQAPTDVRVALVIGNSAYASAPLLNPANDARDMGDTLRGLGFTVIEIRDAHKAAMQEAIGRIGAALKGKQGIGMFYYAGHGLQLDWHNYMVPVDANLAKASDVPAQTVDVGQVIEAFKSAGNRMNILVLDACRDNPFSASVSGKGLAQLDAPPGTFLAFATAPGNVAEDGDVKSGNGLYTQYLLEELKKPASKIEDVFKRVRFQVRKQSRGRQIPWESTSLEDDFYFNTGKVAAVAKPDAKGREVAFNQEKNDWDKIRESSKAEDFYAFLLNYPNGNISELAQAKLERLDVAKVQAQPDRIGEVQTPAASRYRDGDRFAFNFRDGLTGLVVGTGSASLRRLSDDEWEGSGAGMAITRANSAGFILQDGNGQYDPPWPTMPGGEFQVGKRWSSRSIVTAPNGSKSWMDIEARVTAREKVTVPAGNFEAYRVEYNFHAQNGGRSKLTFWYQPDVGYAVKLVRERRNSGGTPDILIRELTAYPRRSG